MHSQAAHAPTAAAGHIEQDESVFDAAGREALEELGFKDFELKPLCAMHRSAGSAPIDDYRRGTVQPIVVLGF
ncbi:MAG: NUDIX domain-containing protein [Oryzihumus sp.]